MSDELSLTAEELTEQAGVPLRTLRYYIAEGLITGPGSRGKGARYTAEHLWRLRAIRQLASEHLPLNRIRERLAEASLADLQTLSGEVAPPLVVAASSPRAYLERLLRTPPAAAREKGPDTWQRHVVLPGVEVSVRADLAERYRDRITRALRILAGGS